MINNAATQPLLPTEKDKIDFVSSACQEGSLSKMKEMVEKYGATIIVGTERPGTSSALTLAAEYGHTDIVLYLLDNSADCGHKGKENKTALEWAILKGHKMTVEVLQNKMDVKTWLDMKKLSVQQEQMTKCHLKKLRQLRPTKPSLTKGI